MKILNSFFASAALAFVSLTACAQVINLPAPVKTGGMPLMDAISARSSAHDGYLNENLDLQTLSDMLWCAYGFNRADKRTVPSAMNAQEFSIYVLLNDGAYLYDAKANTLTEVVKGSLKDCLANGRQPAIDDMPVHLAYVADLTKTSGSRDVAMIDVGYISQNVYLYCASKDLGTCARGSFNRKLLPERLKLGSNQEVVLVQAVGKLKK